MSSKNNTQNKGAPPPFWLEEAEKIAISKAITAGHENPHEDEDHSRILRYAYRGEEFRRYIREFRGVTFAQTENEQVRDKEVDENYCKEVLMPLLRKEGRILHPIMVEEKEKGKSYTISHGHGRRWSSRQEWPEKDIPAFLLSPAYKVDADGQHQEIVGNNFHKVLSSIICNGVPKNKPYTMDDVGIVQLKKLYEADPTFGGKNPSGEYPPSPKHDRKGVFDRIMDEIHPNQFLCDGIRTQIYNIWVAGKSKQTLTVDLDYENSVLKSHGICDGAYLNNKGKLTRAQFLDHYDENLHALISVTKDNGFNADQDLLGSLLRGLPTGEVVAKNIIVLCSIKNLKKWHLGALTTKRNAFLERMKKMNNLYAYLGIDQRIVKLIMPKQLKNDSQDIGVVYDKSEL